MSYNKYEVLKADPIGEAKVGEIVYDSKGWDYGCAADDTRHFGVEHISVTRDATGDYPFFTIPKYKLKVVGTVDYGN